MRRCCTERNGSSISPVLPHDGRVHWNLLLFHFLWDVFSQMFCGNTLRFDSAYQRFGALPLQPLSNGIRQTVFYCCLHSIHTLFMFMLYDKR